MISFGKNQRLQKLMGTCPEYTTGSDSCKLSRNSLKDKGTGQEV